MDELEWHMARAALEWQVEMGATDAIGDIPIDRYAVPVENLEKNLKIVQSPAVSFLKRIDPIALAEQSASAAENLTQL